jgi:hypothetical protein
MLARKDFTVLAFEPAYIEELRLLKSYFDVNANVDLNTVID